MGVMPSARRAGCARLYPVAASRGCRTRVVLDVGVTEEILGRADTHSVFDGLV